MEIALTPLDMIENGFRCMATKKICEFSAYAIP